MGLWSFILSMFYSLGGVDIALWIRTLLSFKSYKVKSYLGNVLVFSLKLFGNTVNCSSS